MKSMARIYVLYYGAMSQLEKNRASKLPEQRRETFNDHLTKKKSLQISGICTVAVIIRYTKIIHIKHKHYTKKILQSSYRC